VVTGQGSKITLILKWLQMSNMLNDGSKLSSKRVTGFAILILLIISVIFEQGFSKPLDNEKFKALTWLLEICLVTIVAEKFSKNKDV
jgi:hypothetical protein